MTEGTIRALLRVEIDEALVRELRAVAGPDHGRVLDGIAEAAARALLGRHEPTVAGPFHVTAAIRSRATRHEDLGDGRIAGEEQAVLTVHVRDAVERGDESTEG